MRFGANPHKHDPRPFGISKDAAVAVLVFIRYWESLLSNGGYAAWFCRRMFADYEAACSHSPLSPRPATGSLGAEA